LGLKLPAFLITAATDGRAGVPDLSAPISGAGALRDLSVMVIVIPFAICFRILITFAYNRTRFSVLIASITHASFNEASEIISPNVTGDPWPKFSRSPQSGCWHFSPSC
jgi:membrane protease YdiL (CAAX protease family)